MFDDIDKDDEIKPGRFNGQRGDVSHVDLRSRKAACLGGCPLGEFEARPASEEWFRLIKKIPVAASHLEETPRCEPPLPKRAKEPPEGLPETRLLGVIVRIACFLA